MGVRLVGVGAGGPPRCHWSCMNIEAGTATCRQFCEASMLLRQQSRMQKPEGFTYSCMEDFLLDRAQS